MAVVRKDYAQLKSLLEKKSFQKRIDSIAEKYQGKKIVIYGAGLLFDVIAENYNLSKLDIKAVVDQKFYDENNQDYKGYKAINPYDLEEFDFDIILLATYLSFDVKNTIKNEILPDKNNLVIEPLLQKNLIEKFEEKLIELAS